MNIGDRIDVPMQDIKSIENIKNILPVKYYDDGFEQWYEVCEADKTNLVAIIGEDVVIIIDKNEKNIELLSDII